MEEDDNVSEQPDDVNTGEDYTTNAGTTQSGKSSTPKADKTKKPNKRQKNPLGNLSSYTYNLTLYMVTPEAYDAFIASGRKNINAIKNTTNSFAQSQVANSGAGAYILAQSAGANKNSEQRAPGFNYDYYIENLRLRTAIAAKVTQSEANTFKCEFDIVEPYGFSFISNLTRARNEILKNSKLQSVQKNKQNLKQIFVLGIRFYGYDKQGNVATTADFSAEDTINPAAQAGGGGDTALFERFYDIAITGLKFKLDGKSTIYNITASALPEQVSMTTRLGRINKDIQIQASTVYEALMGNDGNITGLLASLNDQYEQMFNEKTCNIPNKYSVKFIGDEVDVAAIKNASMIIDSDLDKLKTAMKANNITTSNAKLEASVYPLLNYKQIKFKNDTSILQAISLIIGQSDYLYAAMNTVFSSKAEPDKDGEDLDLPGGKTRIRWYNIGSDVKVLGFDDKRGEWAYDITYVIQPYETPYFMSPYANLPIKYYGPHKRYDYWFTGKNTEVIRYEQQINANYFNVALGFSKEERDAQNISGPNQPQLVMQPQMRTPMARQGMTGEGMEAQNSYLTSLYDPASWASAKIQILGDPDFLMQTAPNTMSQVYDPFYDTDGFTINPNGGQVFIEIDFKEPEDYNHTDGLLSINESIQFVDYPDSVKKMIKGVSYNVTYVNSTFRTGTFIQDLECNIANWAGIIKQPNENDGSYDRAESAKFARQGTGSSQTSNGTTQSGNGLRPDPGIPAVGDPMGSDFPSAIANAGNETKPNQNTAPEDP